MLTAREFVELQAFDQGSPLSEWRADFNAASIIRAIYAAAGVRNVKVSDCMPPWGARDDGPAVDARPESGVARFKSFLLSKVKK